MKSILLVLSLSLSLYAAEAIAAGNWIYGYDNKGFPRTRIDKETSVVYIYTKFGWVDYRVKNYAKKLEIFDDQEFQNLEIEKQKKIIKKYFETEIEPKIKNLKNLSKVELLELVIYYQID